MKRLSWFCLSLGIIAWNAAAIFAAAASTATYAPTSPEMVYTAEKLRDPFQPAAAGGAIASPVFNIKDFSIHNLTLSGLMRDGVSDYAVFTNETMGQSFILRKGRLLDPKGRPVPGVQGSLDVRHKAATLRTADQDLQVYRLGGME